MSLVLRQLQTSTHRVLLSLAVSDFMFGLVFIPITAWTTGVCWVWGDEACVLYFYFGGILYQASLGSMVLISVDRYIAVVKPLHYQRLMSPSKVSLSICLIWIWAVVLCFISMNDTFSSDKHVGCLGQCIVSRFIEIDVVFYWLIPFGIILFLYIQIFWEVIKKGKTTSSNFSSSQVKQRSDFKAAKNLGSVIVAYVICYLPFYCTAYSGNTLKKLNKVYVFSAIMGFLNSAVNPILYVLIYPKFRKAFRAILTLKILRSEPVLL